ncbi:C40 family peptidase [Lysinibacillus sp. LZ02]|uniref:C40 family peptidase n=1 Tax=Lysinibacillus sp. LZ02 TaxID=3420668 RepID=UPI003D364B64
MKKTKWGMKLAALALGSSLVFTSVGTADAAVYTVKSGDSLYKIGQRYGVSYQQIMAWNNLSSSVLRIGQKLEIGGAQTNANTSKPNLVNVAQKYLGIPYVFGGSTPKAGFDCSGYVTYVLNQAGYQTSRKTAAGFYNTAEKVSKPQVGDLVFFSGTYKNGISHVGFYIGNNKMISAAGKQVKIDNIHSGYWGQHFTGYGRM